MGNLPLLPPPPYSADALTFLPLLLPFPPLYRHPHASGHRDGIARRLPAGGRQEARGLACPGRGSGHGPLP